MSDKAYLLIRHKKGDPKKFKVCWNGTVQNKVYLSATDATDATDASDASEVCERMNTMYGPKHVYAVVEVPLEFTQ